MEKVNKFSWFERCVNLLLPLTPILQLYGWSPFEFSFIATLILFSWSLFTQYKVNIVPKYLKAYLWYYLFAFVLGGLISGSVSLPLGWLKIFIIYIFFFRAVNFNLLKRYYSIIVYISITFFLIQSILVTIAGVKITGVVDWLPIALDNMESSDYIAATLKDNWRVCSFFSEPAKFAQFLLPFFTLCLFSRDKFRIFNLVLATSTLLLLKSGNALLIVGVIVLCYIVYSIFSRWSAKKLGVLIVTFAGFMIAGSYYISSDSASEVLNRQDEISGVDYNTSGFYRIYRGYYVFEALPNFEKLIGANNTQLMDKAISRCSVSFLFGPNDYYFNTVQNILIKTGLVGTAIFILFLFSLFRNSNPAGRTIIVALFSVSFVASMYLSYLMLLYLIFANSLKRKTAL